MGALAGLSTGALAGFLVLFSIGARVGGAEGSAEGCSEAGDLGGASPCPGWTDCAVAERRGPERGRVGWWRFLGMVALTDGRDEETRRETGYVSSSRDLSYFLVHHRDPLQRTESKRRDIDRESIRREIVEGMIERTDEKRS